MQFVPRDLRAPANTSFHYLHPLICVLSIVGCGPPSFVQQRRQASFDVRTTLVREIPLRPRHTVPRTPGALARQQRSARRLRGALWTGRGRCRPLWTRQTNVQADVREGCAWGCGRHERCTAGKSVNVPRHTVNLPSVIVYARCAALPHRFSALEQNQILMFFF